MAILAYDDVMLREPRLLVPKQAPLGLSKVDMRNPLTADMAACFIVGQGGFYEPITNARPSANTGTVVATPYGLAMNYEASGNTQFKYNPKWALMKPAGMTVIAGVSLDAASNYSGICSIFATITGWGWEFRLGVSSSDTAFECTRANAGYNQFNGSAGNILTAPTSFSVVGVSYPSAEIGASTTPVFFHNSTIYSGIDGIGSATGDAGDPTSAATFYIAGRSDNALKLDGRIHFLYLWNRKLSNAEYFAVLDTPFGLLIPA